jgi:hypothetical protein
MRGCVTLFGVTQSLPTTAQVVVIKFFESFRKATIKPIQLADF